VAYIKDLSRYPYFRSALEMRVARSVGWLGPADFATAEPDGEFLEGLWQHCLVSVNQTRGLHDCHLCPPKSNLAERNGQRLLLGSAEIRVFSRMGVVYACPNLIYHYVSVHRYSPPPSFVDSVIHGPRPPAKVYLALLEKLGLEASRTTTA
jgi:hypothetical protein